MNAMTRLLLVATGLCLFALLLFEGVLRPDPRRRNYELFPEMARSPAIRTQGRSQVLLDGIASQGLVEGVVVRGAQPFRFGPGPEEALRAGRELASPLAGLSDLAAGSSELYRAFCAICHGADGAGTGSLVQRGMRPPPSLHGARARAMSDGEMFHVLTRGQGTMASYALQLSPEERWRVIHHVRSLQEMHR